MREALLGAKIRPKVERKELTENEVVSLIKVVLAWTEDFWSDVFSEKNLSYPQPRLVLHNLTNTPSQPHYYKGDRKVYFDTRFFTNPKTQKESKNIEALVALAVAHEVAHYVQDILKIFPWAVERIRHLDGMGLANELAETNRTIEQQADFLAGVTLRHVFDNDDNIEESGDKTALLYQALKIADPEYEYLANFLPCGFVPRSKQKHGNYKERGAAVMAGLGGAGLDKAWQMIPEQQPNWAVDTK